MKNEETVRAGRRRYQALAEILRDEITGGGYEVGDKLPTERQISETHDVSRAIVREALIMLEIEGLVEVRQGSGTYVISTRLQARNGSNADIGPFELLQARQLVESNVAALAASNVARSDILAMREALDQERLAIESGSTDDSGDRMFHCLIAKATRNSALVEIVQDLWDRREKNPMWERLHARIFDASYRRKWLDDHMILLSALQRRDADAARHAMWQHIEHVRTTLLELSDPQDPDFDGFLFEPTPLVSVSK